MTRMGKGRMVARMRPGSVIVDIAIDQGGCIDSIRPTSLQSPVYRQHGETHYAVPNMPALVGRTSTLSLTQATEPYVALLVRSGVERALAEQEGLAKGVNTRAGRIVYPAVGAARGFFEYADVSWRRPLRQTRRSYRVIHVNAWLRMAARAGIEPATK